jgi:hypothetical protein
VQFEFADFRARSVIPNGRVFISERRDLADCVGPYVANCTASRINTALPVAANFR